jgi:hypothetical protein
MPLQDGPSKMGYLGAALGVAVLGTAVLGVAVLGTGVLQRGSAHSAQPWAAPVFFERCITQRAVASPTHDGPTKMRHLGVAVLGAVGLAILVYTAQSLSRRKAD